MNLDRIQQLIRALLIEIGEDPDREGLSAPPNAWLNPTRSFLKVIVPIFRR